jgi:hypothetical protein
VRVIYEKYGNLSKSTQNVKSSTLLISFTIRRIPLIMFPFTVLGFSLVGSPQHHKVLFFASRSAKLHDPFRSTGCCKEGVEISVARKAHPS